MIKTILTQYLLRDVRAVVGLVNKLDARLDDFVAGHDGKIAAIEAEIDKSYDKAFNYSRPLDALANAVHTILSAITGFFDGLAMKVWNFFHTRADRFAEQAEIAIERAHADLATAKALKAALPTAAAKG